VQFLDGFFVVLVNVIQLCPPLLILHLLSVQLTFKFLFKQRIRLFAESPLWVVISTGRCNT
jgi:hypothetical protein